MNRAHQPVGRGSDDGESLQRLSLIHPTLPKSSHAKLVPIGSGKFPRNLLFANRLPFPKTIGRNQTPPFLKSFPERRLLRDGFSPGVDALNPNLGILSPGRNQAPTEICLLQSSGPLANHGSSVCGAYNRLGWGFNRNFSLTDLHLPLSPRISAAHLFSIGLKGSFYRANYCHS